jgi:tRNA(Ile)-lysidine synthase TilS/MesJ
VALPKCRFCGRPAIAYVPSMRAHLCEEHFWKYFEGRVEKALRKAGVVRGSKILAAVSGGKDSAALLGALSVLAPKLGFELAAIHIDLGIGEYSMLSRRAALQAASKLGVPLAVIDLREAIGMGVPELALRSRRPPCSVCGLVKRYVLNAAAVEAGADFLATGHNGDDIAAYALKAFLSQDLEAISKLGPATESIEGIAVGRIRPLYFVSEKESFIYAYTRSVPFTLAECPNVSRRQAEVQLKIWLANLYEEMPGARDQLLGNLSRRYRDYPKPAGEPARCPTCGLISSGGECSFCRLTRRILGEPAGPRVREYVRGRLAAAGIMWRPPG